MEKKTYYVAVGPGEILEDPEALNYEFVIQADDDEFDKLQELFEDTATAELRTAGPSLIPFQGNDFIENNIYDEQLKDIYRMLHQLGTAKTRKHIESMHILEDKPEH